MGVYKELTKEELKEGIVLWCKKRSNVKIW
jgi:hypothetical protein